MMDWILHGTIAVGDGQLHVREVVGNVFGLASAILYAGFVLLGFAVWWRASRTTAPIPELEGAAA